MDNLILDFIFALLLVGCLFLLIGLSWIYIVSFRVSIWWGLACTFLPPALPLFAVVYWSKVKAASLLSILGVILVILPIGYAFQSGALNWQELLHEYRQFEKETENMNLRQILDQIRQMEKVGTEF